jgi:hypothetical protein
MNPWLTPVNDIRRLEWWQRLKPETCFFGFTVPELPRLDDLVRLAYIAGNDRYGILQGDLWDWCIQQDPDKLERLLLPSIRPLLLEPPRPRHGQVLTRRMCNHHVPPLIQDVAHIAAQVLLRDVIGWQQVA